MSKNKPRLFEGAATALITPFEKGNQRIDEKSFRALMEEQHLDAEHCLMIGNDRETDIAGAKKAGMDTLYMHTNLTPPDQRAADPNDPHEYEGWDWEELVKVIEAL